MCSGSEARPPLPPIAGGGEVPKERELVLRAADGNRLGAHDASADREGGPGILILPDVRGLHTFYRELALRFAQAGIHACAIDYFGRTAGVGVRGTDFDHRPHVDQTTDETIAMDAAAAIGHLRSSAGGGATAVFSVGFCFGGRNSFNLSTRGLGLAGESASTDGSLVTPATRRTRPLSSPSATRVRSSGCSAAPTHRSIRRTSSRSGRRSTVRAWRTS